MGDFARAMITSVVLIGLTLAASAGALELLP
jgi:hypothetical protein